MCHGAALPSGLRRRLLRLRLLAFTLVSQYLLPKLGQVCLLLLHFLVFGNFMSKLANALIFFDQVDVLAFADPDPDQSNRLARPE